ncbi:hypothetical protein RB195_002814 [Necator americanus]|uniref:glucuronosyltransferase n=1 Tax=Necator americanus TaxID=51031 RepID=A0ABR1DLG9_NECAM
MYRLIYIFLLISTARSLNIVIYLSLVGKSHVDFTSALINSLVDRGHEVDLLIARQNTLVTSNGTHKASKVSTFSFPGQSPWIDVEHLKTPFDLQRRKPQMFLEYVRIASQLCRYGLASGEPASFLRRKKYDIGITSDYDFCGYILFHQAGINTVASFTATNLLSHQAFSLGLPSPASCVTGNFDLSSGSHRPGIFERATRLLKAMRFVFVERPEYEELGDALIREFFGKGFPTIGELLHNSDLVFVNTDEIIEKPRPLSHKVKYIGGIALSEPKPLTKDMRNLLGNYTKNVVFSFGTQVPTENIPLHIRKMFVEAFAHFPNVNFLWAYKLQGDEGNMFATVPNVKLVEWLPQTDLLNDPQVVGFISHMGLNSFLEASRAGVPIIAIPLFADQTHNAHIGAYRGTTIVVKPQLLSSDNLKNALKKLLNEKSYMENAKQLSLMMRTKPENGRDQFVQWIEFAAANKNLHRVSA